MTHGKQRRRFEDNIKMIRIPSGGKYAGGLD
jgi:hypothetical protein